MATDLLRIIRAAVSQVSSDEQPLANAKLEDLEAGHGIRRWKDRTPEENRKAKERKRINDLRSAARRRDRDERLVVTRKEREDRIRNPQRMADVYARTIVPMRHLIESIARAKGNQISRHMGSFEVEDVVSDTIERVAVSFCGYNVEVDELAAVAKELRRHTSMPRDLNGLAKVMAQTANIQARKAVSEWWRANPTMDSIEKLATMTHDGYGIDDVLAHAAADGDLQVVGWKPPRPGAIDPAFVQHIVHGILDARHLQEVADVVLGMDEDGDGLTHRLNSDGSFPWYRYSKPLWLACGLDEGVYKRIPKDKRAKAAQTAVQNRFAIVQMVMERAYALLAEHKTDLNKMRRQILVELPVTQVPSMDAGKLLDALRELMEA